MENINRPMTEAELKNLRVAGVPGVNLNRNKRTLNAKEKFEIELKNQEQSANKIRLPFARHAAREDFDKFIKSQVDEQLRKYGNVEHPEELTLPVTDWSKYSDLKNFDLVETQEKPDTNLSNKNPGLSVQSLVETYKYKGYGQTYKIMEDGPDSIARAIRARAVLNKTITQELKETDTNNSKLKR